MYLQHGKCKASVKPKVRHASGQAAKLACQAQAACLTQKRSREEPPSARAVRAACGLPAGAQLPAPDTRAGR